MHTNASVIDVPKCHRASGNGGSLFERCVGMQGPGGIGHCRLPGMSWRHRRC